MKAVMFPQIEKKFDRMPAGFVNDVRGWSFTRPIVEEAARGRKLLTLDIDMAGKGTCSLSCAHCFRRTADFSKEKRFDQEELLQQLVEAKKLGLKTVKLIGPGEPLEEPGLLEFLQILGWMEITPLIFTKGRVIGDDALCLAIHGMSGRELADRLKELGASILLGTTSFDSETEDRIVGTAGYHATRATAITRLVEAGFSDFVPGEPTRLAFICTPVMPKNIDEVFDMYVWARERHIQPVIAPTMIAGRALDKLGEIVPKRQELLELYYKINIWAIEHGVFTLEDLREQRVAAYAGGAACSQVACGAFLRGDGKVLRCPGDDITILGDLKEKGIAEVWEGSENLAKYAGQYNCGCPPKEGKSFPADFFRDVMGMVEQHFKPRSG